MKIAANNRSKDKSYLYKFLGKLLDSFMIFQKGEKNLSPQGRRGQM